ncbi:MAG: AraC family transcriptional regulator [Acidobacteriota bacterium]
MLNGTSSLPLSLRVAAGSAAPPPNRAFLSRVVAVIEQHLDDEDLQVDTLARHLAMGRTPFYRRLQDVTGCTPARLILETRLETAARLVAHDTRPLHEIAGLVGFKTSSHFGQRFRERFGVSPSAWRRRFRASAQGSADDPRR